MGEVEGMGISALLVGKFVGIDLSSSDIQNGVVRFLALFRMTLNFKNAVGGVGFEGEGWFSVEDGDGVGIGGVSCVVDLFEAIIG